MCTLSTRMRSSLSEDIVIKKRISTNRPPLEVLHPGPTDASLVEVDIVAVHGLGSNADWSWTWKDKYGKQSNVHWLKDPDMLPAVVPNARIMVYSYESRWHFKAPKIRLELCGEELVKSLHDARTDVLDRPLIFIAHSLGGLVVLHGLLYADRTEEFRCILEQKDQDAYVMCIDISDLPERTVGFAALGTPFAGSKMQSIAGMIARLMSVVGSHNGVITEIGKYNKQLSDKVHAFGQLRDRLDLPICCFIELYDTDYGKRFGVPGLIRGRVVNEKSAHIAGWGRVYLHSDHLKLNKFPGPTDRSFLAVSNEIRNMYSNQGILLERRSFRHKNGMGKHKPEPVLSSPQAFNVEWTHSNSFEQKAANFVERSNLLRRMTEEMAATPHFRSILCLYGITGCGKTLIARHFARSGDFTARLELPGKSELDFSTTLARYAEDIPGLIPPSDPVDLSRDLSVTGEPGQLQEQERKNIDAIINWLNTRGNTKWFILIDDVHFHEEDGMMLDEDKHWVQHFIERLRQGTVIITSQSSAFARVYPSIQVDGLEEHESLRLMEKVLNLGGGLEDSNYSKLANLLDNHASSIDSAAQYMKYYKTDVVDYIGLWKSEDGSILNDSKLGLDQKPTKAIRLAIEKLESPTRRFLLICAFLDPGRIWAELFWSLSLDQFRDSVGQLGAVSLIKHAPSREFGKAGFAVPPTVHKIARLLALQRSDAESLINTAIYTVAKAVPNELSIEAADGQRLLLPHVMQCKENLDTLNDYGLKIQRGILPALGKLGRMLQRINRLDDAARFYTWAMNTYDQLPIEERDADYYIILNNFGLIYKDRNEIGNAEACFKKVLESVDTAPAQPYLGDASDSVLNINLALSLIQRGQLNEAEVLLNRAKKVLEEHLDEEARVKKFKIEQYLGTILKLRGELDDAAEVLSVASSGLQALLGNSLESALAAKELGSVLFLQGTEECLHEADKCFEEAEKYIENYCDVDSTIARDLRWHRLMLRFAQCHGAKDDDGRTLQKICDDFEEYIQHLENSLPRNDAVTLHSIRTYGACLINHGRWYDGKRRVQRAIEGYELQGNNPLQAAYANKDLADGYFMHWSTIRHTSGLHDRLHDLKMAKKYYLRAQSLFTSLNSEFANEFTKEIQTKLGWVQNWTDKAIEEGEEGEEDNVGSVPEKSIPHVNLIDRAIEE